MEKIKRTREEVRAAYKDFMRRKKERQMQARMELELMSQCLDLMGERLLFRKFLANNLQSSEILLIFATKISNNGKRRMYKAA